MKRLLTAAILALAVAGVLAGSAAALDFDDEGDHAPIAEVGKIYDFEMPAHAGCDTLPYRFVVESGILPPGLTIGNHPFKKHTGLVSGIPTTAGIFPAWIALKDICGGSAELLFTFTVWVRRWEIETQTLKPAIAGAQYSFALKGKGVPSVVTWTVTSGSLPPGLQLSHDGLITGVPTAEGSATFTVEGRAVATDPASEGTRIDTRQYTLAVSTPLSVQLARRVAEAGVPYRSALTATGGQGPYTWAADGLPSGLTVDSSGSISGTVASAGTYPVHASVTDANGNSQTLDLNLRVARHLAIATRKLPAAAIGARYRAALSVSGGVRPVRWSIVAGKLAAGLRLDARKGTIAGSARSAGTTRLTVRARDAAGGIATKTFVLAAS